MKKIFLTLFFAAITLGIAAQNGTAIIESNSVALYPDDSGESFSINVAGLVIGFGKSSPSESEGAIQSTPFARVNRHNKPAIDIAPNFEFGFNYLLTPDYSIYPKGTREFLNLHTGKSIHFGTNVINVKASLNRSNTLGITSGLTLVWRDYAFSDRNMTVTKENDMLVPVQIDGNFKKTKLSTFTLRVPLLLTISEPRSKIGVGFGGYVDFVTGSHTKYKFPKNKERGDYYVNPVQFGFQARIRYKSMGMFANYGLSDMFQQGKAPATKPLTIGFGFGF